MSIILVEKFSTFVLRLILLSPLLMMNKTCHTQISDTSEAIYFKPINGPYLIYFEYKDLTFETFSLDDYCKSFPEYGYYYFSFYQLDEIEFQIFTTYLDSYRHSAFFRNPDSIQSYFLTHYNKCFFPNDYKNIAWTYDQRDVCSYNYCVSKEDFDEIIKPNFKLDFLEIVNPEEIRPTEENFKVIYCWDFFNDLFTPQIKNAIYGNGRIFTEFKHDSLNTISDVIFHTMAILFDYAYYSPDAQLNGLHWGGAKMGLFSEQDFQNKTIMKYFYFDKMTEDLKPRVRNFYTFYDEHIKSENVLFQEILIIDRILSKYRPVIKILSKKSS